MTITLIGLFDDATRAQQAAEQVQQAGIESQKVHVRADPSGVPGEAEDRRGFFAKLFNLGDDESSSHYGEAVRRGHAVLSVTLDDDTRVDDISAVLEGCGASDVDEQVERWRADGYEPLARGGSTARVTEGQTLQSIEEELEVGKREVQKGRVHIHRTTTERPVEQQVTLREETARIERKPVDRPATEADLRTAFEDQDIEIVETAEEPVVSKSARVVEEVTVDKKVSERSEAVRGSVRSSRVEVDKVGDDAAATTGRRRFAGPERRIATGLGYAGVERRASL